MLRLRRASPMAWQLIYTSAPRSLEAGRSGFGTVARHRAISPLLVSAIERASQFSRLPGVDTARVIYSYRIITIAGGRFHVLSSIRDAGADYTGRTNHIAHHLVAEPRELVQFGATGPSPADVLLGMPWVTAWTEIPRYFESEDEIPLAGFQSMVDGSAWEHAAGHASQAWLLASGEGSRGAYVIRPAGVDLRQLFGESLRLIPERLWQISFTTSLQPSDEPADFRWIGIETTSPLRLQTETSGRPIFNLAEPSTLPAVAAALPAAVGAVAGTASPAIPSTHSLPLPSAFLNAASTPAAPSRRLPASFPSDHGSAPGAPGRRDRRTLWIAVGTVLAAMLLAALIFKLFLPWYQDLQAAKEQRQSIEAIVDGARYFTGPRAIPDLDAELKTVGLADLQTLRTLAELTGRMLDAMRAADFPNMIAARHEYETFRRDHPVNGLDLLPRFNAVDDKLQNAIQLETDLASINVGPEGYAAFESLQQKAASIESSLGDYIPDGERIKSRLDRLGREKLAGALVVLLKGSSRPAQGVAWFETALAKIKPPPEEAETKKIVETVSRVLADWTFVDAQKPNKSTADLEARLKEQSRDPYWPGWLRGLADAKVKTARPPLSAGPKPSTGSGEASLTRLPEDTGAMPPSLSLYFVSDDRHFPVSLPARGSSRTFFLRVEGKSDEELQPFAGDSARGLGPFGEYFKVQDGQLNAGNRPPPLPYVFVGKHDNADVFRIYVGAGRDDKPIFGVTDVGLKRDGDDLVVDLSKLPGTVSQSLSLRLPSGFGVKGSKITVVELHAQRGTIGPSVQELKDQLAKVSGGAGGDDASSTDLEVNAIRAEVRNLSQRPKGREEKKTPGPKGAPNSGDPPADVGLKRPAEMLAAVFEKYWEAQTGISPNPVDEVRAELAKKPEQADWGALLTKLKEDFTYANGQFDGKSQYDKPREWVARLEKLSERVCAYEYRKQVADKDAAAVQARAAKAAEETKTLSEHPLLNGKLPPGVYTLLVGDGDRKLPLVDFKIP